MVVSPQKIQSGLDPKPHLLPLQVEITIDGSHIPGSPFTTLVIPALAGFLLTTSCVAEGPGISHAVVGLRYLLMDPLPSDDGTPETVVGAFA